MKNKNQYKSNIKKLNIITFLRRLAFFGGILIPFFTDWGQLNMTKIFILQSIFMTSIFLFEIPTGVFGDVFGKKFSIFIGCLMTGIGTILYVISPLFWLFAIGEILWGLGEALISGSDEALLYESLKKTKSEHKSKKVISNKASYGLLGMIFASPIGAVIAAGYGLRIPMIASGVCFFLAALASLTLKEIKTNKKSHYKKTLIDGITYFRKHAILRALCFDMVSLWVIAYFMIWFWQKLLLNAGLNIKWFGLIDAVFILSQIFIIKNHALFEKIFRSKKGFLFYNAIIMGIFYIIGGLTLSIPILLSVIIIGGGFGLSREPLFQSYFNKHIPSNKRATVLSTISMIFALTLAILNPIIGWLADISISYTLISLGIAAILLSIVSKVEEEMLID